MPDSVLPTLPDTNDSKIPLPLLVAQKWNFPLAHVETADGTFYAVQDWIRGLSTTKNTHRLWHDIKHNHPELYQLTVRYPYRATDGKQYRANYALEENLLTITRALNAFRFVKWEQLLQSNFNPNNETGNLYIVGLANIPSYYKIGIAKNLKSRMTQLRTDNPFEPFYHYTIELENYRVVENTMHSMLKDKNIYGEWFLLSETDLVNIQAYLENEQAQATSRLLDMDIATGKPLLPDELIF